MKNNKRPATATALGILICALGAFSNPVRAETAYISDRLTVPLRSGPSNANRILHRGLPSGTQLEILSRDEESGFVQVRTDGGTEGWLPAQYLMPEPIARDRLRQANTEIERLNRVLAEQRERIAALDEGKGTAEQSSSRLAQQVAQLQAELAEIRQISAGAIEEHAVNLRLTELNERLRAEVETLIAERDALADDAERRWLLTGAGLIFAGLILGLVIKSRPRRSAWS